MGLRVGIVGATGMVGRTMLRVLVDRGFPVEELRPMSSARSAGSEVEFGGERIRVVEAGPEAFAGLDVALFSAGAGPSRALAPAAAAAGAVAIDNSSAWRLDPEVPLVVPEVNPEAARSHQGIIANPNCCAIPLTVALKPIGDLSALRRVLVDTYQAASGKGWKLVAELEEQRRALVEGRPPAATVYPHVLEGNAVPGGWTYPEDLARQVAPAYEDPDAALAYNEEELKIVAETRKILGLPGLAISVTTVRVPVATGHSESVWVETERSLAPDEVRAALSRAPGIALRDDPRAQVYPLALEAAGTDQVYVGRVRRDLSHPRGLALWLAADNLRKGAATNTVQIAELLFT
ncbi:MAG TPA: aspartate-semialdehyde dehydrogenase [Candidatus Dormibacteraeota bacterium]|jgi:aspartate-semialdehyde dehydrogenase|nr:aspartate-semialdehyde dehydrogenase [Candidatus Dormibacteraeota bacterium]